MRLPISRNDSRWGERRVTEQSFIQFPAVINDPNLKGKSQKRSLEIRNTKKNILQIDVLNINITNT